MDNIGPRRVNVYDAGLTTSGQTPPEQKPPEQTSPEATLDRWMSALHHGPSDDLKDCLRKLAHGHLPMHLPIWLVREMVLNQAFDVFVEVFEAYHALQAADATGRGEPPAQRSLFLRLPPDWAPDLDAMNSAFARMRVEALTVTCEYGEEGETCPPVPAALCEGIVTMLKAGVAKLTLMGKLASPELVAEALAGSSLNAIALSGVPKWCLLGRAEKASFETLILGLKACRSLKSLSIQDSRLFGLHSSVAQLLQSSGPSLASVSLEWTAMFDRGDATALMQVFRQCPTLLQVGLRDAMASEDGPPMDVDCLDAVFLQPLKGHAGLSRIDITGSNSLMPTQSNMGLFLKVFEFAVTCPSFRHFAWAAIEHRKAGAVMSKFQHSGGDLVMVQAAAALARLIEDPRLNLESLTFRGMPLPSEPLKVVCTALGKRLAGLRLDISGSCTSVAATKALVRSIFLNPHLNPLLPMDPDCYYMLSLDGLVWGIAPRRDGPGFEVRSEKDADENAYRQAVVTFRGYAHHLPRLFMVLRRNEMLARTAPLLERQVQQFMLDASHGAHVEGSWIERNVVQTLAKEQRLPTLVQLARVNKAAQARYTNSASEDQRRDLQALVQMETDVNSRLKAATAYKNGDLVRRHLGAGALDTGGHVMKGARDRVARGDASPDLLAAFREFEPRLQPSVPTSTTTATTTTTTSTLTTTTTVATQGTPSVSQPAAPDGGQPHRGS